MSAKILIVEDDPALRQGLADALVAEGYRVETAPDGAQGLDRLLGEHFDLAILDVAMPRKNGFDVCREVRRRGFQLPVLFLTVRSEEVDRVLGLEIGADDYVTKPFSLREILARVGALLRRAKRRPVDAVAPTLAIGDRVVDFEAFVVRRGKREFPLSRKEAAMLRLLAANEGRVVTREKFLDEVWGASVLVGPRTVDTHMNRLRAKVEADPDRPAHLLTVHRVGYRLVL
ncbi:MAG: response regulator transcription factor [Planctomycetes bacterium]|nr:response regulator transcription factor [Planctomycetota bacterium]